MIGEAVGDFGRRVGTGPEAALCLAFGRTEWSLGIAPENRRERPLVALFGADLVERGGKAVPVRRLLRSRLAVASEGVVFAFDAGQFGAGGGEGA